MTFTFADTANPADVEKSIRENTRLILTETPGEPDAQAHGHPGDLEIARKRRVLHAVDNTFLTPFYQRPLELGADLAIHSTTKYMDGHNATVGGAVVAPARRNCTTR